MYGMRRLTKDLLTGLTIFWLMERNGNFKIISSHKTQDLSTPEMFMQVFDANSLQFRLNYNLSLSETKNLINYGGRMQVWLTNILQNFLNYENQVAKI